MKNIYIGDIHGYPDWIKIVKEHEDADNIVFVGDYFDSFNYSGVEQLHNAKEIIEFKKLQELDPSKKVHLLIGNHDIHYYPNNKDGGGTSGYQPVMRPAFEDFFRENEPMFTMCVQIGNVICTHAGISDEFLKDTGYYTYDDISIEDFINDLWKYKPNEFLFYGAYDRGHKGYMDGHGDDTFQSPIWIRPKSLQRANKKTELKKEFIQIVGHTKQKQIDIKGKTTGGRYYYIDTIPVGQYLIQVDGLFTIGTFDVSKTEK
jgi:predicted phosphodiesterase